MQQLTLPTTTRIIDIETLFCCALHQVPIESLQLPDHILVIWVYHVQYFIASVAEILEER